MRRSVSVPGLQHGAPIPNASVVGDVLWSSSIFGKDRDSGEIATPLEAEVATAFDNVRAVLEAGGFRTDDVIRFTLRLRDRSVRKLVDEQWTAMFPDPASRPARHATVDASMSGRSLEIELVAVAATREGPADGA